MQLHDDLIPAPHERYILLAADCIKRAAVTGDSHSQIERLLRAIDRVERAKRKPMERVSKLKRQAS